MRSTATLKKNLMSFSVTLLAVLSFLGTGEPARASIEVERASGTITVRTPAIRFVFDEKRGTYDLLRSNGDAVVRNAAALWHIKRGDVSRTVATAGGLSLSADYFNFIDRIGTGRKITVVFSDPEIKASFFIDFKVYEDRPAVIIEQSVQNNSAEPLSVTVTSPLHADAERSSGFFPGADPAKVWVIENGYNIFFDFHVRLLRGDEPVFSNWNAAFFDRDSDRTAVLGFLTADKAFVNLRAYYDPKKSLKENSRAGLSLTRAVASYDDAATVQPYATFDAERFYIGLSNEPAPHATLEAFADAVAATYRIKPWSGPIPNGWNSWATKYHADLDEKKVLDNARWAAEKLLPFGMTTFQIDDGWQTAVGDWEPNSNFPHGIRWISDEIRKLGFTTTGVWLAPLVASSNSALFREHPEWMAQKNSMAATVMPKDWQIIDTTRPDVTEWLRQLFSKLGDTWGLNFVKTDYIYFELLAKNLANGNKTKVEAYRDALKVMRESLPADAFLLHVGVPTANSIGLADGMRIGLDVKPDWNDEEGYLAQGIKPMVKNMARRYYFNHRVWVNHPDMFYLGSEEETGRWGKRVTLEEARCYATLASLSGGIVKIGDTFTGLDEQQTDLLRRLLPVLPAQARPMDLFEHSYPEVWHLPLKTKSGGKYDVVAFFNWGKNRQWGEPEEEASKTIRLRLGSIGLKADAEYVTSEFWSGGFPFESTGELSAVVPPRAVKVFVLRESTGVPQFVSTNRHVTQGATDVESETWDSTTNSLALRQSVVANFTYQLLFHVPTGYRFARATVDDTEFPGHVDGGTLMLRFVDSVNSNRVFKLYFTKD